MQKCFESFDSSRGSIQVFWSRNTTAALVKKNPKNNQNNNNKNPKHRQCGPCVIHSFKKTGEETADANFKIVGQHITVAVRLWDFSGDAVDPLRWLGEEIHLFSYPASTVIRGCSQTLSAV